MKNENPHRASDSATGAEEDQFQQQNSTASSDPFQSERNSTVAFRQTTNEAACQFLQLILPEEGPYVAWIKKSNGRKYNLFASNISELWVIIKRATLAHIFTRPGMILLGRLTLNGNTAARSGMCEVPKPCGSTWMLGLTNRTRMQKKPGTQFLIFAEKRSCPRL
jgi:hypothetical protein